MNYKKYIGLGAFVLSMGIATTGLQSCKKKRDATADAISDVVGMFSPAGSSSQLLSNSQYQAIRAAEIYAQHIKSIHPMTSIGLCDSITSAPSVSGCTTGCEETLTSATITVTCSDLSGSNTCNGNSYSFDNADISAIITFDFGSLQTGGSSLDYSLRLSLNGAVSGPNLSGDLACSMASSGTISGNDSADQSFSCGSDYSCKLSGVDIPCSDLQPIECK